MKRKIRLTESDLHRIVKESVNRVLREWDEYNEFDRNGDAGDVSPSYARYEDMRIKLLREPYSKKNEQMLLNYLKQNTPEECEELYDQLGSKYPKFKRAWEIEDSWRNNDDIPYLPTQDELDARGTYGSDFSQLNRNGYRGKTTVGTARDLAALKGKYGTYTDLSKNPKNDINLNVYDLHGKQAMDSLSKFNSEIISGRNARSSMRDTYNAAKK